MSSTESKPRKSRADKFESALSRMIEAFAQGTSRVWFKSEFPELYRTHEKQLDTIYDQSFAHLKDDLDQRFSKLLEEGEIRSKLNKLDRLCQEQKQAAWVGSNDELNQKVRKWRPTGDPEQDVLVYSVRELEEHRRQLLELLRNAEADKATLKEEVLKGRSRVAGWEEKMQAITADLTQERAKGTDEAEQLARLVETLREKEGM